MCTRKLQYTPLDAVTKCRQDRHSQLSCRISCSVIWQCPTPRTRIQVACTSRRQFAPACAPLDPKNQLCGIRRGNGKVDREPWWNLERMFEIRRSARSFGLNALDDGYIYETHARIWSALCSTKPTHNAGRLASGPPCPKTGALTSRNRSLNSFQST